MKCGKYVRVSLKFKINQHLKVSSTGSEKPGVLKLTGFVSNLFPFFNLKSFKQHLDVEDVFRRCWFYRDISNSLPSGEKMGIR